MYEHSTWSFMEVRRDRTGCFIFNQAGLRLRHFSRHPLIALCQAQAPKPPSQSCPAAADRTPKPEPNALCPPKNNTDSRRHKKLRCQATLRRWLLTTFFAVQWTPVSGMTGCRDHAWFTVRAHEKLVFRKFDALACDLWFRV